MIKNVMDSMMGVMTDSMTPDEKQSTMLKLMPEMIKGVQESDIFDIIADKLSKVMFITHRSRFGFSETIRKIKASGEDHGWFRPIINNHCEMEQNLGLPEPNKVATISMCIPRAAAEILKVNPRLAVMMPLQINVYEEDDQVYVTWLNINMMGKMFGKTVADVMGENAKMLFDVHKDIIEAKEDV